MSTEVNVHAAEAALELAPPSLDDASRPKPTSPSPGTEDLADEPPVVRALQHKVAVVPKPEPSFYQLPQHCSIDRRRAREATLKLERTIYPVVVDQFDDDLPPLPGRVKSLPKQQDYSVGRKAVLATSKMRMKVNTWLTFFRAGKKTEAQYRRYYGMMRGPEAAISSWREDREFARQRVAGVNPMVIRCSREPFVHHETGRTLQDFEDATAAAAQSIEGMAAMSDLREHGKLFYTDYIAMLHPKVQQLAKQRHPYALVTAPLCSFGVDTFGRLHPLAILVRNFDGSSALATVNGERNRWLVARAHAQASDAALHEGYWHLMETHLVNEAVAVCLFRQLYPEHPLRQLMAPHYGGNMAINDTARGHLLAPNGPIDVAMGAGVTGTFTATRVMCRNWDIKERTLSRDLELRGVDNPETLPDYPYREDALAVHDAIYNFVGRVIAPWYRSDRDVLEDNELRAWLRECADPTKGAIPGFPVIGPEPTGTSMSGKPRGALPSTIGSIRSLRWLLTELIFRAGPQHAAVNNGQYDAYGFIPNTPGMYTTGLTPEGDMNESQFWAGLPGRKVSASQLGMVWVLSMPTTNSLVGAGDSPAFQPESSHYAAEGVAAFRRRLHNISTQIHQRNTSRDVPYIYLDPRNISRSTDI